MSKKSFNVPNIGTQIEGYVIYAAYANQLAIGRALSPDAERQFAIIANRRFTDGICLDEWFVITTYVNQATAEKDFARRCFSWVKIDPMDLYYEDTVNEDDEDDDYETKLSRHYRTSDDDRAKINKAIKNISEEKEVIRHSDEA